MENKKNNFLMQGSILAIAGLITRFIGLVYRIPLTRLVGSEGMTYYSVAYEIYNLALLVSTYSIPVAVSKLVAAKNSLKQYENSNRIFRYSMIFSAILGFVVSLVLFIFADQFAEFMENPSAAIPLRVLAPTIFVFAVMGIIRGFFQGQKTMVPTALSQVIEQIFNAITSVLAAYLLIKAYEDNEKTAAYGASGGTAGTLVGAIFGLLFLVFIYSINRKYFLKKGRKDTTGIIDPPSLIIKTLVLTMLPIIFSQTIYQLSGILDIKIFGSIMSGKGFDESSRAIILEAYSNKYKWLYNLPVAIATAFGVSIVPTLSSSYSKNDFNSIRKKIASATKLNMIVAIPAAAGLAFLAKPILMMLFSDTDDLYSDRLMMLGSIAVVVFALSTLTNGVLQGINRMRLPVIHSAVSLAVHVVLIYVLIECFDMTVYGLVIGNVTYGLLICILNWNAMYKILNYKQEIIKTFLLPAAASIIMGAAGLGIYKLLYALNFSTIGLSENRSNLISTVIAILFAVIIYLILLVLFGAVSEEEIKGFPKGHTLVKLLKKFHILRISADKKEKTPTDENIS